MRRVHLLFFVEQKQPGELTGEQHDVLTVLTWDNEPDLERVPLRAVLT